MYFFPIQDKGASKPGSRTGGGLCGTQGTSDLPNYPSGFLGKEPLGKSPLVMTNIAMENHRVQWENPLFLWAIFNSYFDISRGYL